MDINHDIILKVVDLFSRSSTLQKFFINPALFNFSIFFFYYKAFFIIKNYQDITFSFTSASTLYSFQKISRASTLSQVDIVDFISNVYSNKSNTYQNSINISNIVFFHKSYLKFKKT